MEVVVMEQQGLPFLTVYVGPRLVDLEVVDACRHYRDAVRACWEMRSRKHMTRRLLAEEVGVQASHLTDYLSDKPDKRDMPAKYINALEIACGNRMVTQWLARQASLTIMEQFTQESRRRLA
jgi:hypothetical protein